MSNFVDYGTIWVCTCCMLAHASDGCGCEGMNEDAHKRSRDARGRYDGGTVLGDGLPLSRITTPFMISMGMLDSEHSDTCERKCTCTHDEWCEEHGDNPDQHHSQDDHAYPDDYECDCETDTYSTSQCEGCGTYLHGERHAMWLHKVKRTRRRKEPQAPVCDASNAPAGPTPNDTPNGPETAVQDIYAANGVSPCQHCELPGGH